MKTKLTVILGAALVIISSMGYGFYEMWQSAKYDKLRWEDNYKQVQSDLSIIQLEIGEFKGQMDTKVDSILKEAKIKPKMVKSITNITNNYHDTVTVTVKTKRLTDTTYSWVDTVGCVKVMGEVLMRDTIPTVLVTDKRWNSNSIFIDYTQRRKYAFPSDRFKLWKWRFLGRKERKIKEVTDCGESTFHKVEVNK